MRKTNAESIQHSYQDAFFNHGNCRLKIRQIIITLVCWIIFLVPCWITLMTYWAHLSHGRHGHFFWRYPAGFQEIDFLIIILAFALGIIAVFCLAVGFIQNQRRHGLVEEWPMINLKENQRKMETANNFMARRFGPVKKRQQVRYYVVKPEQNLANNQLKEIVERKSDK